MEYVIPHIKKNILPQQNTPQKIRKTIFMRYRQQSVPKHCTKLTLSALHYTDINSLLYTALHYSTLPYFSPHHMGVPSFEKNDKSKVELRLYSVQTHGIITVAIRPLARNTV